MKKIPVGATIAHAYRFAFGGFFRILAIMWLPLAVTWLPGLLLQRRLMGLSAKVVAQDYSGLREMWQFLLPLYLVAFVLIFMQIIGIAQLALGRRTGPTWFYFSLGKPVWRLIGSFLLLVAAAIVGWLGVALGGGLMTAILVGATKLVHNSAFAGIMAVLVALIWFALGCGFLYCAVRLTFLLTPVVAAEESGFALAHSWTLGLGNFWRMFAILLVTIVPFLVLEFAVIFGFLFRGISFPPPHPSAQQFAAYQTAINARILEAVNVLTHYWYVTYPVFLAIVVVFYGMSVGAQCFAYRALTEEEPSAPVAGD